MIPQSWVGQTIGGRYQIETLIGQGGMSAVYRGVDPNLRRVVAIKLIHPHLSVNPDFVERLKTGAPLAAPRPDLFYTADAEGYSDYSALSS